MPVVQMLPASLHTTGTLHCHPVLTSNITGIYHASGTDVTSITPHHWHTSLPSSIDIQYYRHLSCQWYRCYQHHSTPLAHFTAIQYWHPILLAFIIPVVQILPASHRTIGTLHCHPVLTSNITGIYHTSGTFHRIPALPNDVWHHTGITSQHWHTSLPSSVADWLLMLLVFRRTIGTLHCLPVLLKNFWHCRLYLLLSSL